MLRYLEDEIIAMVNSTSRNQEDIRDTRIFLPIIYRLIF